MTSQTKFQVSRKDRSGRVFVLDTLATIQEANALRLRMNAMTSSKGGGWRKADERYSVVEVA